MIFCSAKPTYPPAMAVNVNGHEYLSSPSQIIHETYHEQFWCFMGWWFGGCGLCFCLGGILLKIEQHHQPWFSALPNQHIHPPWALIAWRHFGPMGRDSLSESKFLARRPPSITTLNTADSMVGTHPNGRFLRNHPHKTCWIKPKETVGKIELKVFHNVDRFCAFTS